MKNTTKTEYAVLDRKNTTLACSRGQTLPWCESQVRFYNALTDKELSKRQPYRVVKITTSITIEDV